MPEIVAAGSVTVDPSRGWIGLAAALIALSMMEIVLGIDNIVFISIATSKLPKEQQQYARLIGLGLAMGFRVLLLCFIATVVSWTRPLFQLALSFLLMIGVMLVAEGFGTHFNKSYVYFATAFSLVVELLNLRINKNRKDAVSTKEEGGIKKEHA